MQASECPVVYTDNSVISGKCTVKVSGVTIKRVIDSTMDGESQ